jgi:hypothetical protein
MIIRNPAAKFASEPCRASPMARPAAPITATKDVVCTPSCPRAARTANARIKMCTRLMTNDIIVGSIFFFVIILLTIFLESFEAHFQIIKISRAAMIFRPSTDTSSWTFATAFSILLSLSFQYLIE